MCFGPLELAALMWHCNMRHDFMSIIAEQVYTVLFSKMLIARLKHRAFRLPIPLGSATEFILDSRQLFRPSYANPWAQPTVSKFHEDGRN